MWWGRRGKGGRIWRTRRVPVLEGRVGGGRWLLLFSVDSVLVLKAPVAEGGFRVLGFRV